MTEDIKGRIGHRSVWGGDGNMVGFGVTMQGQPLMWSLRGTHARTSVLHTAGQQSVYAGLEAGASCVLGKQLCFYYP